METREPAMKQYRCSPRGRKWELHRSRSDGDGRRSSDYRTSDADAAGWNAREASSGHSNLKRSSADKSKCRTNVTGAVQRNKGRVDSVLGAFKSKNYKLF